jgi:CRISPR/Cas system-associated endonuclease/helicase Cas3
VPYKSFPLLTCKPKNSSLKEISFEDDKEILKITAIPKPVIVRHAHKKPLMDDAIDWVIKGAVVLWIENTVREAQSTFDYFNLKLKGKEIGLLHSRFTVKDRSDLEKYWINKLGKNGNIEGGCLLITTQVGEQSLDIDSDILYTSLCPSDMMIQRIGRLWRHRDNDKNRPLKEPIISWFADDLREQADKIYSPRDLSEFKKSWGLSSYVYEPYILCRTMDIWINKNSIAIPDEIREVLEDTYTPTKNYKYLQEIVKDKNKKYEFMAREVTNINSVFNERSSYEEDFDEQDMLDDPNNLDFTRIGFDTKKICLLDTEKTGTATINGHPVSYLNKDLDKSKVKANIYNATISLPMSVWKAIGNNIKEKIIPGDKYTLTLFMKLKGNCWVPIDNSTGKEIPNHYYDNKRGWTHEKY